VEGGVFFVTTSFRRRRLLRDNGYYRIIVNSLGYVKKKYAFEIWAYVLMPSHLHIIIAFPGENGLSAAIRDFKKYSAYRLRKLLEVNGYLETLESLRNPDGRTRQFQVWESRFDDVIIYSRRVLETKINYVQNNPVRAGLCSAPSDWPYSSARDYAGRRSALEVDPFYFR